MSSRTSPTTAAAAMAGAAGDNSGQGSAYVFVRSDGVWSQQQRLAAGDGAADDYFGRSVAVSGDTAVAGAYWDNNRQGSAYVFVRSGGVWSEQQRLAAADGGASDLFGYSVAISADTAVVGAHADDSSQGSAYVFVRSGSAWSQQQRLAAGDGAAGDYFGYSVAVSGDTAMVGAYLNDVAANLNQGSAYVFTRDGSTWSQQAQLLAADGPASDFFGYSVAMSADTAVVGAVLDTVGSNANQGSAFTFELTPYAPEQLASHVVSSRRIDLSWVDSSGLEEGFEIQFSTAAGRGNTLRYPEINMFEAAMDGLLPSTDYAFRVRSYNREADSPWSDWAVATTMAEDPNPYPAPPSGLYATPNAANQLLLQWTDNANNETGFILQRSTNRTAWTQILDGTSNTILFTDTGLTAGATYYYRVRAYNGAGLSAWSEIATGVVRRGPPGIPSQPRVLVVSSSQLLLTWRDTLSENSFRVEAKPAGGSFSEVAQTGKDVALFSHANLAAASTWTYRIRGSNEGGNSGYSEEITATTLPEKPAGPSDLTATPLSNRMVALAWTDNSANETEFRLERKNGATAYAQIALVVANGTNFFDSAVAPSTTYTYRIRAANTGGTSAYSNQIIGATPAGISEGVLRVRPTAIRFTGVAPSDTAVEKLTVVNTGKGRLKVVVGQLAPPFQVIGHRVFTLKAKEQKALKVRYTATAVGKGSATTLGVAGSGRKNPVVFVAVTAD